MDDGPIEPSAERPGDHGPVQAEMFFGLPTDNAAPAIARAYLVEHAGSLPGALIDDALLLVSELVSNAVQHGQPEIVLRIRRNPPGIGVSVQDRGQGQVVQSSGELNPHAPRGRGLRIVDTVSSAWGVQPAVPPPGKIVWFELD
jgi:anti-sigma regulatory factor (Ser/Thr protein kinase)